MDNNQTSLFPKYELTYKETSLNEKEKSRLEKIASSVSELPLIVGEEDLFQKSSIRLRHMQRYIHGEFGCIVNYLLMSDKKIVGYAGIWNGWSPLEMEQTNPMVEIAFLDKSCTNEQKQLLKGIIPSLLKEVEENHSDW